MLRSSLRRTKTQNSDVKQKEKENLYQRENKSWWKKRFHRLKSQLLTFIWIFYRKEKNERKTTWSDGVETDQVTLDGAAEHSEAFLNGCCIWG